MDCPKDLCDGVIVSADVDVSDAKEYIGGENEYIEGIDIRIQCPKCKGNFLKFTERTEYNNIDK